MIKKRISWQVSINVFGHLYGFNDYRISIEPFLRKSIKSRQIGSAITKTGFRNVSNKMFLINDFT